MAVTDGHYITGAVLKRVLHISHTDYDDNISDCIRFSEGRIDTALSGVTSTPITKTDDIEQIAIMFATGRFDLLYRENLTPDLFARAKEMIKMADVDLGTFIGNNYSGRAKYAKTEVKRVTPDGDTNLITDLFS